MRIAAIDLGTNSFHLLVVEARPDGSFLPLVREKEMLRLGEHVSRHGRIPPEAARRVLDTLRRFRALADGAGASNVTACATSAFREAANGPSLVAAIEEEAGIAARIVDGEEEARLVYRAIRASVLVEQAPALALDLGGGSLEVMVGDAAGLWWATSLPLGAARLSAELVRHDPLSKGDRRRLRRCVEAGLGPVADGPAARLGAAPPARPAVAVVSGGTWCDVARVVAGRRSGRVPASVNQVVLGRRDLLDLERDVLDAPAARRRLPGLDPRRADLVPAGITVLATAMDLFGFDDLVVSEWGLREGIVLEALRRAGREPGAGRDIRRAGVEALARRCQRDEARSRHVAALAVQLFDGTRPLHGLGGADRELLEFAALLHDIGEHVSVLAQHKHTGYLVEHAGLRGFGPDETAALAALARYGSGGRPKPSHEPFGSLDRHTRRRVVRLAALLRLATGLDRGRRRVVESVAVEDDGVAILLHVRSRGDCDLELWAAAGRSDLFEEVFGRRLAVAAEAAPAVAASAGAARPGS